jgi:hypothetical protein
MEVERNERSPYMLQSLKRGDFVEVRLNANIHGGMVGFVLAASPERLRLWVHSVIGNYDEASRPPDQCLAWDVVFPMTSVAWIRHQWNRPAKCECREALT